MSVRQQGAVPTASPIGVDRLTAVLEAGERHARSKQLGKATEEFGVDIVSDPTDAKSILPKVLKKRLGQSEDKKSNNTQDKLDEARDKYKAAIDRLNQKIERYNKEIEIKRLNSARKGSDSSDTPTLQKKLKNAQAELEKLMEEQKKWT